MRKKVFISFDYDHDQSQKHLLVGQSKLPDSPFDISDVSIKQEIEHNWELKAKEKIKNCDILIVLCGYYTDTANGVSKEVSFAKELGKPYYLIRAYKDVTPYRPKVCGNWETIHDWDWNFLKRILS